MLQRTRAEKVKEIYTLLLPNNSSIEEITVDSVLLNDLLKPLGLEWRNKKIIELIKKLKEPSFKLPNTIEELLELPGVGVYIANAFVSLYFGKKAPIIDGNAVRVWGRVFTLKIDEETHKKKWFFDICLTLTPENNFKQFNFALLDLSRKICIKKPKCDQCPINVYCEFFKFRGSNTR